jgi:hypothetical protein
MTTGRINQVAIVNTVNQRLQEQTKFGEPDAPPHTTTAAAATDNNVTNNIEVPHHT